MNPPPFKTVALIGKYQSQEVRESLRHLADFISSRGLSVLIDSDTARTLGELGHPSVDMTMIGQQADLAIVVGGDGTLLNVARQLHRSNVPLLGVNQGRVGFLTDVPTASMEEDLTEILAGHYIPEQRLLLDAWIERKGRRIGRAHVFNDVVVNMGAASRMIEFNIAVDGQFVCCQRSDGLVVATPTGSTAYALSAGGPILHPTLPAIVLAPICPHTLTNRPIVINSSSRVAIMLKKAISAHVHFDGQSQMELMQDDIVHIRRSRRPVRLLHPIRHSYYATLRQKLHWNSEL